MKNEIKKLVLAISRLSICNPFSPERFEIEKQILGKDCEPFDSVAWNRSLNHSEGDRPNVIKLKELAGNMVGEVTRQKQIDAPLKLHYWNVATYWLLYRHITILPAKDIWSSDKRVNKQVVETWKRFRLDFQAAFSFDSSYAVDDQAAAHLFACLAQIHRAFFNIFDHILGESLPIARLRKNVWESIFTCNIRRYHDSLFDRMRDLSTLITGPSGTGKELVARAIGLSQYVPFDPQTGLFQFEPDQSFLPLNLSALSPTLIESELFGHRKGAFTGAVEDRKGWLESCSTHGAVFLDEIGELETDLQVKLLRVLQQRTYCRLGETGERRFNGKIIAATNRNLVDEIADGHFREDFYFRICSDRIETPSLRSQLDDRPGDLGWLVGSIVQKKLSAENPIISAEATRWIENHLGTDYPWDGNIRELEQCVCSYIIRQEYTPMNCAGSKGSAEQPGWLQPILAGSATAEELLNRYCTWLYSQYGSYEKTAKVLKIDRRTVKSKIDDQLLSELNGQKICFD